MKNPIIKLTAILALSGLIFLSCNMSSSKVENAQKEVKDARENLTEAQQELYQARIDSIQLFKQESLAKISANEKTLSEFKAKIANEINEDTAKYNKTLAWLEQKNNDMKKALSDFNDDGQEKWTSFKREFNHDMDEFGKSFKDLTTNNVK